MILEGSVADAHETSIAVEEPTSDEVLTIPAGMTGKLAVSSVNSYNDSAWNGSQYAPTQDAVRDKIEALAIPAAATSAATVGLTREDGVATTYKRSDASDPISQSISPTWVGPHTFSGNVTINGDDTVTGLTVNANNASVPVARLTGTVATDGASAADPYTFTTFNGDGAIQAPRQRDTTGNGWLFGGMVQIHVNGTAVYVPYYTPDPEP